MEYHARIFVSARATLLEWWCRRKTDVFLPEGKDIVVLGRYR
jgi:hypothetical protein